jgi:hypothetical protein
MFGYIQRLFFPCKNTGKSRQTKDLEIYILLYSTFIFITFNKSRPRVILLYTFSEITPYNLVTTNKLT